MFKYNYNNYLGRYHYFHRHTLLSNKPRVEFIEITNYCNLNCPMCVRRFMTREVGFMKFDLFKKIIDQIKDTTDFILLHNFGEPLFHPELELFINYCSANKIKSGLSTNATILDVDKSRMLLASPLRHIILCLDGVTKDSYNKLRPGADFNKTTENITNFIQLAQKRNKKNLTIEVQIIKTKLNSDEIETFKRKWEVAGVKVRVKKCSSFGNQIKMIPETYAFESARSSRNINRYPCVELWTAGGVHWNGDFVVCCMDYNGNSIAGNFYRDSLKDMWNSPAMLKLRKEHIENNYNNPLCKNCTEWSGGKMGIFQKIRYSVKIPKTIYTITGAGFIVAAVDVIKNLKNKQS